MANEGIHWIHSLTEARDQASGSGRLLLIDLFNPH